MQLQNSFSTETRELFYDVRYICFMCGHNGSTCGGIELHHIKGRISASPCNAAPLCKCCHGKANHSKDEEQILLHKTKKYLDRYGYCPTDEDMAFYEKYYDPKYRSKKQNASLHKGIALLSQEAMYRGIQITELMPPKLPLDATPIRIKEDVVKPIVMLLFKKDSTTKLESHEIDELWDYLIDNIFAPHDINVPFPSVEAERIKKLGY